VCQISASSLIVSNRDVQHMRLVFAVAALALTGCAFAPISPQEQSQCGARPSGAEVSGSVQAYIARQNLKDPDSVRVRSIQSPGCVAREIGGLLNGGHRCVGWQIDFEVNAKNSYGGYTGFESRWLLRTSDGMSHWWGRGCVKT
jgi:hypothetical protein